MFLSFSEAGKQVGLAIFRLIVERPLLLITLFFGWINKGNAVLLLIGWLAYLLLASVSDEHFVLMVQNGFASNLFYVCLVLNVLLYGFTVARDYTDNPNAMIKDLSIFVVACLALLMARLTAPEVIMPAMEHSWLATKGFNLLGRLNAAMPLRFFDFAWIGITFTVILYFRRTVKMIRRLLNGNGHAAMAPQR